MATRTTVPDGTETVEHAANVPSPAISAQETQPQDMEKQPPRKEVDDGSKKISAFKSLGILDRFLAVWILLAMIVGVLLGNFVEETGPALQKGKFVGVSIPIAVGLLVMMYPILCKVRYESLHELFSHRDIWKQIGFSIFVNWVIAPFVMVSIPRRQSWLGLNILLTSP